MSINRLHNKIYINLSSKDSIGFFPLNKQDHFISILGTPLELVGSWEVGLVQVFFTLNSPITRVDPFLVDVSLSQISETLTLGSESSILKRALLSNTPGSRVLASSFQPCDLVGLRVQYLDRFEVFINSVEPDYLSFDPRAEAYVTLILKRLEI